MIIADRASRTADGCFKRLVELAEALQAPVIDQGGRMNFLSRHPLNQSSRGRTADRRGGCDSGSRAHGFLG